MHPGTWFLPAQGALSSSEDESAPFLLTVQVKVLRGIAMEKIVRKQGLDPEWKLKLTECLKEIGLLSAPCLQVMVNVADYRVSDVTKQERLK
jgi:hypothetical protein